MVKRQIIHIDESRCDGCGQCVPGCEEGVLRIINGKARLVSDVFCDGLGACLGHCPRDAISLVEREAEDFDQVAVARHLATPAGVLPVLSPATPNGGGCPGSRSVQLRTPNGQSRLKANALDRTRSDNDAARPSGLMNWPVQLQLVPPQAPYLQQADLLLVADCVPFSLADFHRRFLDGRPVLIGCPKLDDGQYYVQKLTHILQVCGIRSITVVRMEVPCCMGLTQIARAAIESADVDCPLRQTIISVDGQVLQAPEPVAS